MISPTYRVIPYGVGAIDVEVARVLAARADVHVVAATDAAPDMAGRDLGRLAGLAGALGVPIAVDAEATLAVSADLVVDSTGSCVEEVAPQLLAALATGKNALSTCEELS